MKQVLKYILVFASGVGCGVGGCYTFLKKKTDEKIDETVSEVRKEAKRRIKKAEKERDDAYSLLHPCELKDETGENVRDDIRKRAVVGESETAEHTDYTSYFDGGESAITYVEGLDEKLGQTYEAYKDIDNKTGFSAAMAGREHPKDDVADEDLSEEEQAEQDSRSYNDLIQRDIYADRRRENVRPYPIDYSDMCNQNQWYEKLTYTYYVEDNVLCDDGDQPISFAEYAFPGWTDLFGTNEDDPDVIYIRNPAKGSDYEVCRIAKAYSDEHVVDD